MNLTRITTTLLAGLLAGVTATAEAHACMPMHPPEPWAPTFDGGSPYAVIARPISMKSFEEHGIRYWRASYAIIARRSEKLEDDHVTIEWSCDPGPYGRQCAALLEQVLPGFTGERADDTFVQLELRYRSMSTFDGVMLHYASRDGAFRIRAPTTVAFDVLEGARPKCG